MQLVGRRLVLESSAAISRGPTVRLDNCDIGLRGAIAGAAGEDSRELSKIQEPALAAVSVSRRLK